MSSEEESLLLFQCSMCMVLCVIKALALEFFDEGSKKCPSHCDLSHLLCLKLLSLTQATGLRKTRQFSRTMLKQRLA